MLNYTDLDNISIEKDKKEKMVINKEKNKNNDKIYKQDHNDSLIQIQMMKDLNIIHMYIMMKKKKINIYLQLIKLVKTKNLLN